MLLMLKTNQIYDIDAISGMQEIASNSVDLILVDLPYGCTKNKWDAVIPLEQMWEQFWRILKPRGVICLFSQGIFTVNLINSSIKDFRYDLIWKKKLPTGFLNANRMPLREHESICVFYKQQGTYNPQCYEGPVCHKRGKSVNKDVESTFNNNNYGNFILKNTEGTLKYPKSVLEFEKIHGAKTIHPTQKPLDLCRYLVRTYSNAGDVVLDCCCGSGTIPLAAKIEDRQYIGMDNGVCLNKKKESLNGKTWALIAQERIKYYEETGTDEYGVINEISTRESLFNAEQEELIQALHDIVCCGCRNYDVETHQCQANEQTCGAFEKVLHLFDTKVLQYVSERMCIRDE
jgi:DNA modification methylase